MKSTPKRALTLLVPALLLAGIAWPRTAVAPPLQGEGQEEEHEEGEEHEGPLAEEMEHVSDAVKRLRRALKDESKRDECLELVVAIQKAALEVKQMVPPMAETVPESERPAFVAAYRKLMAELLANTLELEVALIDGDQKAAAGAYKKVRAMEDKGHERFTEDG